MSKYDISNTKKKGYIVNLSADDWELYYTEDMDDDGVTEADRIDAAIKLNAALEAALNGDYLAAVEDDMNNVMAGLSEWGATDTAVREVLFAIGEQLFDQQTADEFFNL